MGGDLWRPPGPTPLLKQSHLEQAQVVLVCPGGFEVFQGVRLHSLLGKPVPFISYPHSKSFSLFSEGTTRVFSLCLLPLVLSLSTAEKDLAPSS